MKFKSLLKIAALLGMTSIYAGLASADQPALTNLNANYNVSWTSCNTCHTSAPSLNQFGTDFKAAGGSKPAYLPTWTVLDNMDSDNDGILNVDEFKNGTEPAGLASTGGGGGEASVGGCLASSSTAPLMMLFAMLTLGFFIRRK